MEILRTIYDIIRRNPLTTLFVIMLAVAAPGVFGFFAILILVPLIFAIIGYVVLMYRVRRVQKDMESRIRDAHKRGASSSTDPRATQSEGKVTVHIPPQEQRINDDVGEYIDFKEE